MLYSMETLIPSIIRNATNNMERSKVLTLGPFCYVLLRILQTAESCRMDITHTHSKQSSNNIQDISVKSGYVVWRSSLLTEDQMQMLNVDDSIILRGFVSCTQKKELAEQHALNQRRQSVENLVLFKITLNSKFEYFRLDRSEYSCYSSEKEVLLSDGITL